MSLTTSDTAAARTTDEPSVIYVDPRAPRFGQTLTTVFLLAGIVLAEPLLIGFVAVVLATAVVSRWRVDLWAFLWRRAMIPLVGKPAEREPAAPHRFAKLLGATGTTLAVGAFVVGVPLVGYGIAGLVAVAAGLAAVTNICLGCRLYRQVSFVRRAGLV